MSRQLEIVVDGTDCAGKTPLVEQLVAALTASGRSAVACCAFQALDPYDGWVVDALSTAAALASHCDTLRKNHADVDVLVWDRGWPTVFVDTENTEARAVFGRRADVTVLLLNSVATTEEKAKKHGLSASYITDPDIRRALNRRYRSIAHRFGKSLEVFIADPLGRFDYDVIVHHLFYMLFGEVVDMAS